MDKAGRLKLEIQLEVNFIVIIQIDTDIYEGPSLEEDLDKRGHYDPIV
jgi:hypothetical protein